MTFFFVKLKKFPTNDLFFWIVLHLSLKDHTRVISSTSLVCTLGAQLTRQNITTISIRIESTFLVHSILISNKISSTNRQYLSNLSHCKTSYFRVMSMIRTDSLYSQSRNIKKSLDKDRDTK